MIANDYWSLCYHKISRAIDGRMTIRYEQGDAGISPAERQRDIP